MASKDMKNMYVQEVLHSIKVGGTKDATQYVVLSDTGVIALIYVHDSQQDKISLSEDGKKLGISMDDVRRFRNIEFMSNAQVLRFKDPNATFKK